MNDIGETLAKIEAGETSQEIETLANDPVQRGRIRNAYDDGGTENVAAELGVKESYKEKITEYEIKENLT